MNEWVSVYGFGSSFGRLKNPKDIDILLVHRSTEQESCQFAITCKRDFLSQLDNADVTILSVEEAETNNFILKSSAIHIGTITSKLRKDHVRDLLEKIRGLIA